MYIVRICILVIYIIEYGRCDDVMYMFYFLCHASSTYRKGFIRKKSTATRVRIISYYFPSILVSFITHTKTTTTIFFYLLLFYRRTRGRTAFALLSRRAAVFYSSKYYYYYYYCYYYTIIIQYLLLNYYSGRDESAGPFSQVIYINVRALVVNVYSIIIILSRGRWVPDVNIYTAHIITYTYITHTIRVNSCVYPYTRLYVYNKYII